MTHFKLGQRVRKIAVAPGEKNPVPIGAEGVIAALPGWSRLRDPVHKTAFGVDYAGHPCDCDPHHHAYGWMLAPILPVGLDAWAADKIRQLAKTAPPIAHVTSRPPETMFT